MRLHRIPVLAAVIAAVLLVPSAALACGGLISPNGTVQLQRTTTLVGYVDGVEHYVTSFAFAGGDTSFGSIVPLPDVPTVVERAGDWTLQRSLIEIGDFPVSDVLEESAADAPTAAQAEVLLETTIDSLDITILRGGADEVVEWADNQGFLLSDDTPEVLDFYAERSEIFMAARFDAPSAAESGFLEGDGIPIHLAIPTDDPWVPIRILALGKQPAERVEADVFLLTPAEPSVLAGEGLTVRRQEFANQAYLDDLRSDTNSGWVPETAWFTHLRLDATADQLTYDLAVEAFGGEPDPIDAGLDGSVPFEEAFPPTSPTDAPTAVPTEAALTSATAPTPARDAPVAFVLIGALVGAGLVAAGITLARRAP